MEKIEESKARDFYISGLDPQLYDANGNVRPPSFEERLVAIYDAHNITPFIFCIEGFVGDEEYEMAAVLRDFVRGITGLDVVPSSPRGVFNYFVQEIGWTPSYSRQKMQKGLNAYKELMRVLKSA